MEVLLEVARALPTAVHRHLRDLARLLLLAEAAGQRAAALVRPLRDLPENERGRNRGSKKIEWSLYSVKKILLDTI